jgi:hypothetical protein
MRALVLTTAASCLLALFSACERQPTTSFSPTSTSTTTPPTPPTPPPPPTPPAFPTGPKPVSPFSVEGRVLDHTEFGPVPLPGFTFTLARVSVTTDASGWYSIRDLPGIALIDVDIPDGTGYLLPCPPSSWPEHHAGSGGGAYLINVDLVSETLMLTSGLPASVPVGNLRGLVVEHPSGLPVPGATVELFYSPPPFPPEVKTVTDPRGNYAMCMPWWGNDEIGAIRARKDGYRPSDLVWSWLPLTIELVRQ